MPPIEPKGQHFVHRAYLDGFLDPSLVEKNRRALWLYMKGKSPIPQASDRIAKRNYYYCHRREGERGFEAEHTLQKLEDVALPLLTRLRLDDHNFSAEERLTFAGYVALSYTRVPTFEKLVNELAALDDAMRVELAVRSPKLLEIMVRKLEAESGTKIDVNKFRTNLTSGSAYAIQTDRNWSLRQMFESMLAIQQMIIRMRWCFLKATKEDPGFLTSDNPVALFLPGGNDWGLKGLKIEGPYFTFPIARQTCFLATAIDPIPSIVAIASQQVRQVNWGTITRADSQLYAPFKNNAVQRIFDKVCAQKKDRRVLLQNGRVVIEESERVKTRVANS